MTTEILCIVRSNYFPMLMQVIIKNVVLFYCTLLQSVSGYNIEYGCLTSHFWGNGDEMHIWAMRWWKQTMCQRGCKPVLMFCPNVLFMWTKEGVCEYKQLVGVWGASILDQRKANWKHMCCSVQQFRVVVIVVGDGCSLLLWMRVLVMGERKRGGECLWGSGEVGGW